MARAGIEELTSVRAVLSGESEIVASDQALVTRLRSAIRSFSYGD
jgi:hypothetical protein